MDTGQAEALAPMVDATMREANLAFSELSRIAVTFGPGTFTGVRIGLAFARGLGVSLAIPVIGINSLAAIAANEKSNLHPVIVASDARGNDIYTATFDANGRQLMPPAIFSRDAVAGVLPSHTCLVLGTGADAVLKNRQHLRGTSGDLPVAANFVRLAASMQASEFPPEPLYLLKAPNTYLNPLGTIRKPLSDGKVVYEGELGVVIGRVCTNVAEEDALSHVFGYTCANDVTVSDIIQRDPTFPQWVRAKGFDTFLPFGPVIATGLDPAMLVVRTMLNEEVRQDYPINDMVFPVQKLVSMISRDMTLYPGDMILCGTSVGVGSMKPGSIVEVEIGGIGKLRNRFE